MPGRREGRTRGERRGVQSTCEDQMMGLRGASLSGLEYHVAMFQEYLSSTSPSIIRPLIRLCLAKKLGHKVDAPIPRKTI